MIQLIGTGYYKNVNYIIGHCHSCREMAFGILTDNTTIKCECKTLTLRKPPLYYLKSNKCPMVIYKLTHVNTGKHFIGVIITTATKNLERIVDQEVKYIRDFREFKISPKLKKALKSYGVGDFTTEILSTTKSLTSAMIEEKLYIGKYKALEPDGFNQVPIVETLIKRTKRHD